MIRKIIQVSETKIHVKLKDMELKSMLMKIKSKKTKTLMHLNIADRFYDSKARNYFYCYFYRYQKKCLKKPNSSGLTKS